MTTAAEWLALAERARKADGPDSRIDNRAACLLYGWREVMEDIEPYGPVPILIDATGNGPCISSEITASLDAIVALIEKEFPGCDWQLNKGGSGTFLVPIQNEPEMRHISYEGNTPALALVAAFCLAKAAQAKEDDNGR